MGQLMAAFKKLQTGPTTSGRRPRGNKRRQRPRNRQQTSCGEGAITLSRCELMVSLVIKKGTSTSTGHVDLIPSSFSFLKGIAKSFDRLKWNNMRVFYKPAVGTVYGGLVSYGVDWDFSTTAELKRPAISGLTPNYSLAAHADSEKSPLVLPSRRIQSRLWYSPNSGTEYKDMGPGKLMWAVDGMSADKSDVTVGELWVAYSVTMQGTNPA